MSDTASKLETDNAIFSAEQTGDNAFLKETGETLKLNQYWYSDATIRMMADDIQAVAKRIAFLSTPSIYFSLTDASVREASALFDFDDKWADEPGFVHYDFRKPEDIPVELHHTFDGVVIDPPFVTDEVWEQYAVAARLLLVRDSYTDGTEEPTDADAVVAEKAAAAAAAGPADTRSAVERAMDDPNFNPFATSSKTTISSPVRSKKVQVDDAKDEIADDACTERMPVLTGDAVLRGRPMPKGKILLTTIVENDRLLSRILGVTPRRFRPSIPNLIYQYSLYTNYPTAAGDELNSEIDAEDPPGNSHKKSKYSGMGMGGGGSD